MSDARQWVLGEIDDRTEADPESEQGVSGDLWTAKDRLVKHAGKFSTPVKKSPVKEALQQLIDEREVLYWHGHLTRATIPYLNAVVQSEQQSGVTRQMLVDKCRRWLEAKAGSPEVATDGGTSYNEIEDGGSKPTIYLAGPVAAYQDGGAAWRDRLVEEFSDDFAFKNPLDKYNVPVEDLTIVDGADTTPDDVVSVTELVESDKQLLEESDAILVGYSAVRSAGTPMEVMWAYERDIPVAVWIRDGTSYGQLSPWYRYHAGAVVGGPKDALHYLWANVPAAAREVRR